MPGAPVAPPAQHVDEGGEIVLNRFYDFLARFTSSAEGTTDGTDGVQLYRDYLAQIGAMVQNDKNTVYVDVQHVFAVSKLAASTASHILSTCDQRVCGCLFSFASIDWRVVSVRIPHRVKSAGVYVFTVASWCQAEPPVDRVQRLHLPP